MSQAGSINSSGTSSGIIQHSVIIDYTQQADIVIFTNGASRFVPLYYTFVTDTLVNFSGDGSYALGFTNPDYDDYAETQFELDDLYQFSTFVVDSGGGVTGFPMLPPTTDLVLKITSGMVADEATGRIFVFGFEV
jgi:hypothetical protein